MLFQTLFSTVSTPISYLLSASSLAQSSQQRLPAKATALVLQESCRQPLQKEPTCYPSTRMEGRQEKNTLRSKVKALVSPSYTFSSMNWRTWARLWSRTDPLKFRGEGNPPTPSFFFFFSDQLNQSSRSAKGWQEAEEEGVSPSRLLLSLNSVVWNHSLRYWASPWSNWGSGTNSLLPALLLEWATEDGSIFNQHNKLHHNASISALSPVYLYWWHGRKGQILSATSYLDFFCHI